ncbi:DODA-type extradiol aromatic ring-opening family dioxygenase [Profundibacter sp.]|uniref:DODA-type extradiol aromatic ring-opening family dioxygenase n=1 Tax=Profundibacter sp. TaxID=3101071 RepID=UPI003D0CE369
MTYPVLPSLFLSHGAPSLVLEDCPARHFLAGLGAAMPRPRAIVVCSAHYEAAGARIGGAERPETVHDFGGFPDALYQMTYPALGDPVLAADIAARLKAAGINAGIDPERGLDHGIWNPLMLAWPKADVPVLPLSITPSRDLRFHHELGRALAPLRHEGILLIGSGAISHNLGRFFGAVHRLDAPEAAFARGFADWITERCKAPDPEVLLNGIDSWPGGRENHPTDDHILPLLFALGAGGEGARGKRLHRSTNYAVLPMDVLQFS